MVLFEEKPVLRIPHELVEKTPVRWFVFRSNVELIPFVGFQ